MKMEKLLYNLNLLALLVILLISIDTFIVQFTYQELPCPLCLLQRFGLLAIAFGFILNLRFGLRPSHYGVILLSGFFTAVVALRHIALHAIPGSATYGSPIWGMHLYSWAFVIAMTVIFATTALLSIDWQYQWASFKQTKPTILIKIITLITLLILLINVIAIFLQCGWQMCPDSPTKYQLLS